MKKLSAQLNKLNQKFDKFVNTGFRKKIFQFFPNNLYLFILFLVLLPIMTIKIINNDTLLYRTNNTGFTDEIVNESVKQKIKTNYLEKSNTSIGILFGTYMRENNSNYKFELLENNKVIYSKKFNSKNLKDNDYYYFSNKKIKFKKGYNYEFVITPLDATPGNAIAAATGQQKDIAYILHKKSDFYVDVIIISSLFLLIFFGINYLINNNKIKNEVSYLLLTLIYILPLIFIYAPYQTPDEPFHFNKTVRLSQVSLNRNMNDNMTKTNIYLPSNYSCLNYAKIQFANNVVSKNEMKQCLKQAKNKKYNVSHSKADKLVSYIPASVGVKIADTFSNSPMVIFYMGRLFNFICSFLILLLAIKQIPKYKKLILLVSMIPMFIQQMISYSYDSMLNSLCILVMSYFIKFLYSKKIDNKDLVIYTIASIIILDIKAPYFLLCLPILFLNSNKFGNKKEKIKKILFITVSIFISYIFFKFVSNYGFISSKTSTDQTGIGNSISFLFNIKHLLLVIYKTLTTNGWLYLGSMIGNFGWMNIKLNDIMVWAYLFILIISIISEKNDLPLKNRIINIILVLSLVCGVFLAMYLYWTPTNALVIEGVQGRYFLAALPLLMISFIPKKNLIDLSNKFIFSFINISMIVYIVTILVAFY